MRLLLAFAVAVLLVVTETQAQDTYSTVTVYNTGQNGGDLGSAYFTEFYNSSGGSIGAETHVQASYVSGSLAPGGQAVFSVVNDTAPGTYWVSTTIKAYFQSTNQDYVEYSSPQSAVVSAGQPTDVYVAIGGALCVSNISYTIYNADSVVHNYVITEDPTVSGQQSTVLILAIATLYPGGSQVLTANGIPCSEISSVHLLDYGTSIGIGAGRDSSGNSYSTASGSPSSSSAPSTLSPPGSAPPVIVGGAPNLGGPPPSTIPAYNPTNNPTTVLSTNPATGSVSTNTYTDIVWTGTNTQAEGFQAIYDAITKGNLQEYNAIGSLAGSLTNGFNNLASRFGTNGNNVGASNVWVQNWPSNFDVTANIQSTNYIDLTNYATQTTQTNILGTLSGISNSLFNASNSVAINSTLTNATDSTSAANAAIATEQSSAQTLIDSGSSLTLPGSPSAPSMTMYFCGQTIDLDPVHMFPNVAAASFLGWKIVLLLAFFIEMVRLYWQILQIKATTQTGGVPDVGSPFMAAGNAPGLVIAAIVPFVFLGIFVTLIVFFFASIGYTLADAFNFTSFTDSLGSIGYYILASFFPVQLAFSLVSTRITLGFTMGKLIDAAVSISRFLIGH